MAENDLHLRVWPEVKSGKDFILLCENFQRARDCFHEIATTYRYNAVSGSALRIVSPNNRWLQFKGVNGVQPHTLQGVRCLIGFHKDAFRSCYDPLVKDEYRQIVAHNNQRYMEQWSRSQTNIR